MVGNDTVVWLGNSEWDFSIASCYEFYERSRTLYGPPIRHAEDFGLLWFMDVPFKIKAFRWRLFHNRLPMKDLLVARGMSFPLVDLKCILCGLCVESMDHFFFGYLVVKSIWSALSFLVGKGVSFEEECLSNFMD